MNYKESDIEKSFKEDYHLGYSYTSYKKLWLQTRRDYNIFGWVVLTIVVVGIISLILSV